MSAGTEAELSVYLDALASKGASSSSSTDGTEATLMSKAYLGRLLLAQGKWTEALPCLQLAVEGARGLCNASAENKFLWTGFLCEVGAELASTLDYLGDVNGAEAVYNELLSTRPSGTFLGDYAIFLHRRKRDFVQAEAFYVRALQLHPHQSSVHLKYAGFLRHVKKDLKGADAAYRMAIETDKTNADAIGSYASFLHGVLGKIEMAGELYAEAIKQDTFHANNLCNYGLFLSEEKGKYALAEDLYKRALTNSPRHANTLYNYAVMLDSHLGRKDEAEDLYRRSLEVEPKHAFALYNLAVLLEDKVSAQERSEDRLAKQQAGGGGGQAPPANEARLVKRQEVAALYARAVDCDPKDATTTADYGRYLLTRIEDADKAEEVLFKAAQLDPDNAVAVYNLALLLHRHRGNLSGAEALLNKLAPKHVASLQLLARVQLDKFRASQDQRDLEDCLLNFQRAMEQLRDPALCMLEYLKVVLESGSNRQRVRAMGAVESLMAQKKVAREADVRTMINNVKKLAEKA